MTGRYTAEQYQRWHVHDCVRCGRRAGKAANWEGPICRSCCDRAVKTRGRCPGCAVERLLPGRDEHGSAICRDCAAITRDFFCARCSFEGHLHTGRLCTRCTLSDQLHHALDDGTGRVHPPLVVLHDALVAMPNPLNGWFWLRSPQVQALLTDLATGHVALTHDALQELPNWRTVAYLRDLLMHCGALPVIDKQLLHFQTWLHQRLAGLTDSPHHRVLRQFGLWHLRPQLAARAAARPLTPAATNAVRQQFTHAARFLTWLDHHGRTLATVTQIDIDTWSAHARNHQKQTLRGFLTWAINARHLRQVELPALIGNAAPPITQARRLALLRQILNGHDAPLRSRVAACLLLLYAQPASRIVRLTIDDVVHDPSGQVLIRLGDPPSPVPAPFAALLLEHVANRTNMNSATNPDSRWLFPGRRAGQPLNPTTLLPLIRALGIPVTATRTAALRQLVLQAPAPVVAKALGFHYVTTHRHNLEAGGTWKTYAPGDHAR